MVHHSSYRSPPVQRVQKDGKADQNGNYVCNFKLIPLSDVANYEKKVPIEWINESHNGVKHEFIDYVLPLIQGEPEIPRECSLPRYARLKKVLAK